MSQKANWEDGEERKCLYNCGMKFDFPYQKDLHEEDGHCRYEYGDPYGDLKESFGEN